MIGNCVIKFIVAMDANNGIGGNNDLLWHIPDDLKRFKKLTMGAPMLMGRKTGLSLGRALPGRENLVLTRSGKVPFEGMVAVSSLEEAAQGRELLWVIGGGEVFSLAMPYVDEIELTLVHETFDADVFFPPLNMDDWNVTQRIDVNDAPLPYTFLTLVRKPAA